MRIARSLTVSPSMLCARRCTWSQGGVPGPGGCTWSHGVYLVPGGTWYWGVYLVLGGGCLLLGGCTWSQGGVCFQRGIPGPGGVSVPGGTWSQGVSAWGVYLVVGGVPYQVLPPCGQTDACKHIILPQTSFAGCKDSPLHTWIRKWWILFCYFESNFFI